MFEVNRGEARAVDRARESSRQWREALAHLLGHNNRTQDLRRGLAAAAECDHPDARWLCSVFASGPPQTPEEAAHVLLSAKGNERSALALGALVSGKKNVDCLRRAAEAGHPLAQSELAVISIGQERLEWATKAAAQGDPRAKELIASLLWPGIGSHDRDDAIKLYREAADDGDATAQYYYAIRGCKPTQWERFRWLGMAAVNGDRAAPLSLVFQVSELLRGLDLGKCHERAIFEIGAVLEKNISESGRVFGLKVENEEQRLAAARSVGLYKDWCAAARRAIKTWSMLARRFGVVKDVRVLVAKELWADKVLWTAPVSEARHLKKK